MYKIPTDIASHIDQFVPIAQFYDGTQQYLNQALDARKDVPRDVLKYISKQRHTNVSYEFTVNANEIITEINVISGIGSSAPLTIISTKKSNITPIHHGIIDAYTLVTDPDYLYQKRGNIQYNIDVHGMYMNLSTRDSTLEEKLEPGKVLDDETRKTITTLANKVDTYPNSYSYPDNLILYCRSPAPEIAIEPSVWNNVKECLKLLYQLATVNHYWMPSTHYMLYLQPKVSSDLVLLPKDQ